ncbi:hypothetical protein A0H81_02721 [Grifola frondosa]|uniref:Uncharacterized protein n=1 Tax=Grifola frondosa TaxID=5627 RepID=A0A1C7MLW8_GRIFR|nr:hypothetical protein A0H81_02721 [Grifola frondosa]
MLLTRLSALLSTRYPPPPICRHFTTMEIKYPAFYTKPMTQVVIVGMTCFATVGMFSAISSFGAGGTEDVVLSDTSLGVYFGMFALTGLVSGAVCNASKLKELDGSLSSQARFLVSLCIIGVRAGLDHDELPTREGQGKGIRAYWAIFQSGSFIGSLIALGINVRHDGLTAVATSTYIVFLVIIFVGIASSFLVLPPNRVIRADGTIVKLEAASAPHEEIIGMWNLLKDWRIFALLPMFFASNYFYAYQGARWPDRWCAANGLPRARHEIPAPARAGYFGLAVVATMTIIVWSISLSWQVTFTRKDDIPANLINYKDKAYRGKGALYFFYFFLDACYQALAYWILGALTNDPFKLARYAGHTGPCRGGAGGFAMDAVATPLLNEHLDHDARLVPLAWLVLRTVVYVDDIKKDELEKGGEEGSVEKASISANANA